MRLAAALLMLALPALAGEAQARAPRPARKGKPAAPKQPWEALLESSRAALEASRGKREPVAAAPARQVAPPTSADLLASPAAQAPAPAPSPAATTSAVGYSPADDAPDLVSRPRRVIVPAGAAAEPVAAPEPQMAPLLAEPLPQTAEAVAISGVGGGPIAGGFGAAPAAALPPPDAELNFDLLDKPGELSAALSDPSLDQQLGMRRTMLTMHQTVGIGLLGLMASTMVTGQLNYLDRFGGPSTARYEQPHQILATATLVAFGSAGLLAFFAPVPIEKESEGIDRVTLHKFGMIGATAGMVAEGVLGILTAHHEGLADQSGLARAHLVIGYSTLAFMTAGVGALVF